MNHLWPRVLSITAGVLGAWLVIASDGQTARAQTFSYQPKPRASYSDSNYANPDPAPRMMLPADPVQFAPAGRPSAAADDVGSPIRRGGFNVTDDGYRRLRGGDVILASATEPVRTAQYGEMSVERLPPDGAMQTTGDPMYYGPPGAGQEYVIDPATGQPCVNGPPAAGYDYCAPQQVSNLSGIETWFHSTWLGNPAIWQNFNELSGMEGFKGPVDQGINGNFGFHKGVNWAMPAWESIGLGYQLGGVIAVSDLSGSSGPVNSTREQYFVTTGFFRRANCNSGLQGGAVIDYLHDNFYLRLNLLQIRPEISYVFHCHEVGLWSAVHLRSNTQAAPAFFPTSTVTWQSNDQFNLFYRYTFCNGGVARTWIGLSGVGDLILGSDATAPLSERWAIQVVTNYLIPRADPNLPNAIKESWGVTASLIWYPGYRVPNACFNPYRPLFVVADNGSMFVREK